MNPRWEGPFSLWGAECVRKHANSDGDTTEPSVRAWERGMLKPALEDGRNMRRKMRQQGGGYTNERSVRALGNEAC